MRNINDRCLIIYTCEGYPNSCLSCYMNKTSKLMVEQEDNQVEQPKFDPNTDLVIVTSV